MTTKRYSLLPMDSVPAVISILKDVIGITKDGVYFLIRENRLDVVKRGPRSMLVKRQSIVDELQRRGVVASIEGDELVVEVNDEVK